MQAPHRHFDFAPHVKTYALVEVLNKGLVYEELEWDFAQSQVSTHHLFVSLCYLLHPLPPWAHALSTFRGGGSSLYPIRAFWTPSGVGAAALGPLCFEPSRPKGRINNFLFTATW